MEQSKKIFSDYENGEVAYEQARKLIFNLTGKQIEQYHLDTYWGLESIGPTSKAENKELYDLLHVRGVMCMISAAPSYDKLPEAAACKKAYREIIQAGADVIESDLPIEVAETIAPLIPAKSPKQRFLGK